MRARASKKLQKVIRMDEIPTLKVDAADYIDLIDWQSCELIEPPLIKDITVTDLSSSIAVTAQLSPFLVFVPHLGRREVCQSNNNHRHWLVEQYPETDLFRRVSLLYTSCL